MDQDVRLLVTIGMDQGVRLPFSDLPVTLNTVPADLHKFTLDQKF